MTPTETVKDNIIKLLMSHAAYSDEIFDIAKLVADKSFEMNHLYKDMGFDSRKEMNDFMSFHFPTLSIKKPNEIRWKKFLFDTIGEIAPACWHCKDSTNCFKCEILEKPA